MKLQQKDRARARRRGFAQLKPYLTGEVGEGTYAALAADLNMTEGAVKTALHRLRREFGVLLRIEVRHSFGQPFRSGHQRRNSAPVRLPRGLGGG